MKSKALVTALIAGKNTGRKIVTALITVLLFSFLSAAVLADGDQEPITDAQISKAVQRVLLNDPEIRSQKINISVNDGIVTLSGSALNLIGRDRSAETAKTVRGVKGVINTIKLNVAEMADNDIRHAVESALLYDPAANRFGITASVKDGVVTLYGKVKSYREQLLAADAARGVIGVKAVKSDIKVDVTGVHTDPEISAEVNELIDSDNWLESSYIIAAVKGGVVTLTGTVGSAALRDRAVFLAMAEGVQSVDSDGLNVDPDVKENGQRSISSTKKSDLQIKKAVISALGHDPRVAGFNPDVKVMKLTVSLTGVVDNLQAKIAAGQDAKNTVGVWHVNNLLVIRPSITVDDSTLAKNVESAMQRDAATAGSGIKVEVKDGVATLTGTVDSDYVKTRAYNIASLANGMLDVKNDITDSSTELVYYSVNYDPAREDNYYKSSGNLYIQKNAALKNVRDADIKANIEEEMFWSPWITNVKLKGIKVSVSNGIVTLTGTVNNLYNYNRATDFAFRGGAREVYNNITIR
jgi:osmotically-inducible protein OsmY